MTAVLLALAGVTTLLSAFALGRRRGTLADEPASRGDLLATVARAARSISSLDSARVLGAVADAALSLQFDAVEICLFEDQKDTYTVIEARGLPDEYVRRPHPSSTAMTRLVREQSSTVVIDDYSSHPSAAPELRDAGFRSVIGTPVWAGGRLAAVLIAGTHAHDEIGAEKTEAFELLAINASIALENARRFEDERRTVERLNDLDRMKEEFLSTVSHELRTPLTAIEAAGFTLEERWHQVPEELKLQLLSRLNANARTLEGIITSLLDFSRMTGGKPNPSMQEIDLGSVLEAAAARVGPLFSDRSLGVAVGPGLRVYADPMLIDRVVENLLSNAAKHTPKGAHVFLRALKTDTDVTVSVADDGHGIPADELQHLSDRFFRGRHANEQQTRGLGLGLALVREILREHGAALDIQSTAGAGARFAFTLPLLNRKPQSRISA